MPGNRFLFFFLNQEAGAAAGGHIDVSGLHWHMRPWWYPDHTATKSHVWTQGPIVAEVCGEAPVPCYHQRPCGRLWFVLQPEAMLMSVDPTTSRSHTDLGDLQCDMRLSWCLWSRLSLRGIVWARATTGGAVLSPENMWKPMTHTPDDCKEYFCSDIHDCRSAVDREGQGRLLWKLLPTHNPSHSPKRRVTT